MGQGLLAMLTGSVEHLLYGHLFSIVNPVVALPLFYGFGLAFLIIWMALRREFKVANFSPMRRAWKPTTVMLVGDSIGNLCWFSSFILLGLSGSAAMSVVMRLLTISYGVLILKERMTPLQMAAAGVVLTCTALFVGDGSASHQVGVALSIVASLGYTVATVARKYVSTQTHHRSVILARSLVQFPMFLAMVPVMLPHVPMPANVLAMSPLVLAEIAIAGIFGSVIVHHFMMKALATMDLSVFSLIMQLRPLVLFACGFLLFGEQMTDKQVLASVLMMAAMFAFLPRQKALVEAKAE